MSLCLFLSGAFCQETFDGLLFFEQKGPHDTALDARGTAASTVGTAHSPLPLLEVFVASGLDVLDSW
jgi:hypothetical protein